MRSVFECSCWTLAAFLTCPAGAGNNPPVNAELVGEWNGFGGSYGDVWGVGEYAYIGHFGDNSVNIIDISAPSNPFDVAEYSLSDNGASAQDVKVAEGLLFVAVASGGQTAEVVDVRDPTQPAHVVTIDIPGFGSIHNLFYDNGYLYITDSGSTRVGIVDLTTLDPDNPPPGPITTTKWILENVGTAFVHDVTVAGGRLYVSAWDSGVWIYDVTNVATEIPSFLGQSFDGDNTHSAWPTANGDYVVSGEEREGGGIKVHRITDNGGSVTLLLTDSLALPANDAFSVHNQLIDGYRLYNSWYGAGLMVHDIDPDTGQLEFVASFDTSGSVWGVYPFLGQDRVLLSDISDGFFIVSVDGGEPCPWDLNGSGDVGIKDFLELLANWGNPYGIVDFLELLADWGPCP